MNGDSNINRTNTLPYRGTGSFRVRGRSADFSRGARGRGRGRAINVTETQDSHSSARSIRARGVVIPPTHHQSLDGKALKPGNSNYTRDIEPNSLISKIKRCPNFTQFQALFDGQKDKEYFNSIHASTLLKKLVNFDLDRIHPKYVRPFIDKIILFLSSFDDEKLLNSANHAVKLLRFNKSFALKVFNEINKRASLEAFKPLNLNKTANSAVKLFEYIQNIPDKRGIWALEVLSKIFNEINKRASLEDFNAQELANVANCAVKLFEYTPKNQAKWKTQSLEILSKIFAEINQKERLESFKSQELANTANCALKFFQYTEQSRVEWKEQALEALSKVFIEIKQRESLIDFKPQELANTGNCAMKFFQYIERSQDERGILALEVLSKVFIEIKQRESLKDFKALELANTANCALKFFQYTKKSQDEPEILPLMVLSRIFTEINQREGLTDFKLNELVNVVYYAAKFFDYSQENQLKWKNLTLAVSNKIFTEINQRESLEDFGSDKLAKIAYSIVKLCYCESELLEKINKAIYERDFNTFSLQTISNLAWAFSITGQSFSYEWMQCQIVRLIESEAQTLSSDSASQLYKVFLKRALNEKTWNAAEPDQFLNEYLPEAICSEIYQFLTEDISRQGLLSSDFQKDVKKYLERTFNANQVKEEYYIKPFFVDFAIVKEDKVVALIEVNGPYHFRDNDNYTFIHQFKQALIKQMGYPDIININYQKWGRMENNEKEAYFQSDEFRV